MILPGLLREFGYDYSAIQVVFENCQLSPHERELYQEQIVALIKNVIDKKRSKEDEKTCNPKKRKECEVQFGKENMEWTCKTCEENPANVGRDRGSRRNQ